MNFNVVSGDYSILSEDKFDEFKADYLNSDLSSNEVRLKWNLSKKQYSRVTKKIREELGLLKRPYRESKHYYENKTCWSIIKHINQEKVYFGSVSKSKYSEDDVKQIVAHCKSLDWDKEKVYEYIGGLQ